MDQPSRKILKRLHALRNRPTPLTDDERTNLINSVGLYKLLSNHSPAVTGVIEELLERK